MNFEQIKAKQAAAKTAASFIQNGMVIGLGTGSTAAFFIESLIERLHVNPLKIHAFPSSEHSAKLARAGGILLCNEATVRHLDLTIDGADEVDPKKRMIKGGGGALLREKIIAAMSQEMIVIVDPSKLVNQLGKFPLPIEISPFAHQATLHHVLELGYKATLRLGKEQQLYKTDNGNYIVDISFSQPCKTPEKEEAILKAIPGVIETGFFFNLAGRVIIGQYDGGVRIF